MCDDGKEDDRAKVLGTADEPEPRPGWMFHEGLPMRKGETTVKHGAVVAIARRKEKKTNEAEVEKDLVSFLVPWFVVWGQNGSKLWPHTIESFGSHTEKFENAKTLVYQAIEVGEERWLQTVQLYTSFSAEDP